MKSDVMSKKQARPKSLCHELILPVRVDRMILPHAVGQANGATLLPEFDPGATANESLPE
jgi:hypothetical protein